MDDLTESDRARYCEAMLYDYEPEWRPPGEVEIDRPDLLAWKTPGRPPWASRVAYAKWDEHVAERAIDDVLAFFGDVPFVWHVGPSSTPADLVQRLVAHGMTVVGRTRMMTIDLPLADAWPTDPELRIVDVVDEPTVRLSIQLAGDRGPLFETMVRERMENLRLSTNRRGWLIAYLRDVPVANAGFRYSTDGRCVYLTGAETVEAYRGRGVYKTVVAYRARGAAKRGCVIASILAQPDTSAPILARHGFRDHGEVVRLRLRHQADRDAERTT